MRAHSLKSKFAAIAALAVTASAGTTTSNSFTQIVAPNSGTNPGQTTVEGSVFSAIPESAAMALVGFGLIGLGFVARRKSRG